MQVDLANKENIVLDIGYELSVSYLNSLLENTVLASKKGYYIDDYLWSPQISISQRYYSEATSSQHLNDWCTLFVMTGLSRGTKRFATMVCGQFPLN